MTTSDVGAGGIATATPVAASNRIDSIDVLRGVAVLGILVLNIQSFAMIGAAYMNPTAWGDLTGGNRVVWYISHVFGDQKFMSIFSMLFGAGIVLMSERLAASGRSAVGVHYRRMGWLVLFGLLHAHLLWFGDILFIYAMIGMVVFLLRRLPPTILLIGGAVMMAIGVAVTAGMGWSLQYWPDEAVEGLREGWAPTAEVAQNEIDAFRGSWLDQAMVRTPVALMLEFFLPIFSGYGWKVFGMMLTGMGLFKLRLLDASRSAGLYAVIALLCLGLGIPTVMWGVHQQEARDWALEYGFFYGMLPNFIASSIVAIGYICLVMLACRLAPSLLLRPLAAVGRMALTNYLMQTIICTTIFYGHGFGLFSELERTQQIMIVFAIWAAQLIWSPLWLSWFRYGPFEWLWRSLTYLSLQPLTRAR